MDPASYEILHQAFSIILALVVVAGNFLLLAVHLFRRDPNRWRPMNTFMVSIATASFIIGILIPFQPGYFISTYTPLKNALKPCTVLKWLDMLFLTASGNKVLCMTAIAAERYRSVVNVRRIESGPKTKTAIGVVAAAWIINIAYNLASYASLSLGEMRVNLYNSSLNHVALDLNSRGERVGEDQSHFITFCYFSLNDGNALIAVVHSLSFVLFFVLPLFCMALLYLLTAIHLHRLSMTVNSKRLLDARWCTIKALITIIVVFIIVWLPAHIFNMLSSSVERNIVDAHRMSLVNFKWRVLHDVCLGFLFSESWIYVVVYALFVDKFTQRIVDLCRKKVQRRFSKALHAPSRAGSDLNSFSRLYSNAERAENIPPAESHHDSGEKQNQNKQATIDWVPETSQPMSPG